MNFTNITIRDIRKARKVALELKQKSISRWGEKHYQDLIHSIDLVLTTTEKFKEHGRLEGVE